MMAFTAAHRQIDPQHHIILDFLDPQLPLGKLIKEAVSQ